MAQAAPAASPERWVTLGSAVTETVEALGHKDKIVAVDRTSAGYSTGKWQILAYYRQLTPESILALRPTRVLGIDESGPPATIKTIEKLGIKTHWVDSERSVEGGKKRLMQLAKALGAEDKGKTLWSKVEKELGQVNALLKKHPQRPKVLFLFSHGGAQAVVAGSGTGADNMITLAGGTNIAASAKKYFPLNPEAAMRMAPDYILTTRGAVGQLGGPQAISKLKGLEASPAVTNKRIIVMSDELLLGFGPRLGEAALYLAQQLHPEKK